MLWFEVGTACRMHVGLSHASITLTMTQRSDMGDMGRVP
jgi:hypothetical protein